MIITYKGHKRINFKNGYTISIFNGYGSYSENHFNIKVRDKLIIKTKNCEIGIIYANNLVTNNILQCGDSVKGYINKKELKEIIKKVKEIK